MNPLKYLFNKKSSLKQRGIYAVVTGDYMGQFFVLINTKDDTYEIMSLPDNIPMEIDKKHIHNGLSKGILDFIRILPKDIFELIKAEYYYRINNKQKILELTNKPKEREKNEFID